MGIGRLLSFSNVTSGGSADSVSVYRMNEVEEIQFTDGIHPWEAELEPVDFALVDWVLVQHSHVQKPVTIDIIGPVY